jgi:uncharacterized membrane protein YeaQ/YmgE (transglycosylase-associated protein family)
MSREGYTIIKPLTKKEGVIMIGMCFVDFLILLLISIIVSAILHYGFKYYVRPGLNSFISKVILGWIGAWLGSPVLGHWFAGVQYGEVYIIPAILGSLAILIILIDYTKSVKGTSKE